MRRIIALLVPILFLLNMSLAYTVTVIIDGIGLEVTCDPGEEVEVLPKLEEIEGWEVVSGGITIENNKFTMPENDVVIEGIINSGETVYTITYNANGGEGVPERQIKATGIDLILSSEVPTRDGYTFIGWNTNSNATVAEYNPGETFTRDLGLTLYAIWKENNYLRTITVIEDIGGDVSGEYENYKCSQCGGLNHECEVVNIFIELGDAEVTEV